MTHYSRQITQAARMVRSKGQLVAWVQPQRTDSSDQPWKTVDDVAGSKTFQVNIVFLRPSGGLANALYHLIKGMDAPTGAPRGLMAALMPDGTPLKFTPNMTDNVIRDGQTLVVKSFNVLAPDGDPILYDIEFA